MGRCIDEDLLIQKISRMIDYCEKNKDKKFNALNVLFQVGDAIMDCPTVDVISKSDFDLLKSTITHKEEQAYAKGYADAKADLLEKLQADIARDSVLAEYGDELFEGRIAGFKVVMNYILSEE